MTADKNPYTDILYALNSMAANGIYTVLDRPECLLPLNVTLNTKDRYREGVIAAVLHIYHLIGQTADGRKAISDLGYKPLFEYVECPGSGGRDD